MASRGNSQCAAAIAACIAAWLVAWGATALGAPGVARAAEPAPAAGASGQDAESPPRDDGGWREARPPDEAFSVRMPGAFQRFRDDGRTDAGAATHTSGVRANVTAAFGAVTQYVASCLVQEGDARAPAARVESAAAQWRNRGQLRFQRPLAGPPPGTELEVADASRVVRSRIYATASATCTVLVAWRPYAPPAEADVTAFLDSFHLARR